MKNRIEYLDGHRGVAILLVICYHAFARWPNLVPYGNTYASFPLFKQGSLGVELFFLLSGFVILMTLEKSHSIGDFLYRRWLRLFPAMLICSAIVFMTTGIFYERPAGEPTWQNLLPGLSFVDSAWWTKVLHQPMDSIEGSFWSLFVEFKFYVIAAIFFFARGRRFLILALAACYVFALLPQLAGLYLGNSVTGVITSISTNLSLQHFGWFAAGAAFFLYVKQKSWAWFAFGCALAALSSVFEPPRLNRSVVGAFMVSSLFAVSFLSEHVRQFLSNRVLQYFGFVSYPLYLIHENMMISMVIKLGKAGVTLPSWSFPVMAVALLSGVSWVLAKHAEPRLKGLIDGVLRPRAAH